MVIATAPAVETALYRARQLGHRVACDRVRRERRFEGALRRLSLRVLGRVVPDTLAYRDERG